MEKLKFDKQNLQAFGKNSAIGFVIIGTILFLFKKDVYLYFWIAAGIFALLTLVAPKILKVVYITSMRIADPIGWVMSRVILSIFFFLIMTPIGLLLRLFGKDLLNQKIDKNVKSYWIPKETNDCDKVYFERRF